MAEAVEAGVQHTLKGLERWLEEHRWSRRIPEEGLPLTFHVCSEGCKIHDQK